MLATALLTPVAMLQAQTVYEGNASGNAIEGTAVVESCSGCLNGTRVGDLGNGSANYLRIKNISVATTGTYTVTLYYTVSGTRSFTTQINGVAGPALSNLTGTSWTSPNSTTFSANFTAGSTNSVGFFNATAGAPDVDHITVSGGTGGGGGGGTACTSPCKTINNVYVTLYGWPDNSPPGAAIAYPKNGGYPTIHNVATIGGTYANPSTFATAASGDNGGQDPTSGEEPVGTIIYYPKFQKYFILEDECSGSGGDSGPSPGDSGNCEQDWKSGVYHFDLWLGGQGGSTNSVEDCENGLTSDGNTETIYVNPPSGETVNTTPLWTSSKCWSPN